VDSLQGFRTPEEVERFGAMMDEMCYIVATKHSGSLKARAAPLRMNPHRPYLPVVSEPLSEPARHQQPR